MNDANRSALFALGILFASLALSLPALAEDAAELDRKARAAFEAKDYKTAAETFIEAYRIKPHPATKYNEALAWDRGGDLPRAADAYESALDAEGLDTQRGDAARSRLAALKPQLAYLFVEKPVGGTVTVAHVREAPIPARIHLTPGTHEIALKQPSGSVAERKLSLKAGTTTILAVDEKGSDVAPRGTPEPPRARAAERPHAPAPAPAPVADSGCTSCTTWGWVSIGTAVAAAGAGTYLGLRTLSARDEFDDSGHTDADAHDRAVSSRTLTNVAFGVAAVTGGLGIYLLIKGKGSSEQAARVEIRPRSNGVSGALRF